jgi:hypothetical protein
MRDVVDWLNSLPRTGLNPISPLILAVQHDALAEAASTCRAAYDRTGVDVARECAEAIEQLAADVGKGCVVVP